MKTIQTTIDELLLAEVDRISQALKIPLQYQQILELEHRHAQGYARHPVEPQEFAVAESDLVWEDA